MSFILDALKKSETDRQQRSSAEFTKVPSSDGAARTPGWLLILGILLAINLVALLGLLYRSSTAPADQATAALTRTSDLPGNETDAADVEQNVASLDQASFAERLAEAKRNEASTSKVRAPSSPRDEVAPSSTLPVISEAPANVSTSLPTIFEVVADGIIEIPELHLDIHVYSEIPQDRFVFINMSKQREKSQLGEGPVVEEITPDGVILAYRGTSFLLPRD
ncbi:MAG: general secretion pathway protein GspB [Woeseiaceae bacterium]